jgi:pimeloyl-ACP methyl ester carboxylesterase
MTDRYFELDAPSGPVEVSHDVTVDNPAGDPIALTCRWPAGAAPKACVIFCHGLGSSGREYAALSGFWAQHGYLVIHPTFPDSVVAVAAAEPALGFAPDDGRLAAWATLPPLRTRLFEILHSPDYWLARIEIVRQVMDGLDAVIAQTVGKTTRSGSAAIAGHSFGAYTSQLFAGAEIDIPGVGTRQFRDDRFTAAILLSAQGRDQQGLREGSWAGISGPLLNVTGTLDGGAKGQDFHWKMEPYDFSPPGDKYLAVLEGADHYLGGFTRSDPGADRPEQREAVCWITLAFLEAFLAGNGEAKSWLSSIADHVGDCRMLFRRK